MIEEIAGQIVVPLWCCREWLVNLAAGVGRCGYCGRRPVARHHLPAETRE